MLPDWPCLRVSLNLLALWSSEMNCSCLCDERMQCSIEVWLYTANTSEVILRNFPFLAGSPCAPKMPWLLGFSSTAADMAANVPIPLRVGFRVLTDTPVIFLMVQRHSAAMCLRTDACFWHRRTSDVPEYYGGEGDMTVPVYGYFIRGAQTTFNGVFRSAHRLPLILVLAFIIHLLGS